MTATLPTYELTIIDGVHPGKPPMTMNEFQRCRSWKVKNQARDRIHYQVMQALQKTPIPTLDRVRLTITQYAPDGRKRDADGLSPFRKSVQDALVRLKVVPDDNTNHLIDGGNWIITDREHPRMIIRLDVLDAT